MVFSGRIGFGLTFLVMPRIAFVTCPEYPALTADDRPAAAALVAQGATVVPVIWSDPSVAWDSYDLIVLRSMWDYHLHVAQFADWLAELERTQAPVWNPVLVARWNMDKRYLRHLRNTGVPIIPTVWFEPCERPDIAAVMDAQGWKEAVIKPVISSTAFRTWRIDREQAAREQAAVHALLHERPAMLQEYQPAIRSDGEWSLTFIDGELSHTVVKRAAGADFRVQEEWGGTTERAEPTSEMQAVAEMALRAAPGPWVYGRVDGVRSKNTFLVMELELLEPGLFFLNAPEAAARFADSILAKLR
jgi:glutathione synthase/RimK-type ligase-like ATP-grasp enzyme